MTRRPSTSFGNLQLGAMRDTDSPGNQVARAEVVKLEWSAAEAATASTTAVHAAATGYGSGPTTVNTGITNPPCPRAISATAGGTAGDIAAGSVVVTGTNINDQVITETLPAFTLDTAGTVHGSKAFKTVTSYVVPDMDGNGASVALGFNDKLGLPFMLSDVLHIATQLGGTPEGTAPTFALDADEIEKNTVDLNSALSGAAVQVYMIPV